MMALHRPALAAEVDGCPHMDTVNCDGCARARFAPPHLSGILAQQLHEQYYHREGQQHPISDLPVQHELLGGHRGPCRGGQGAGLGAGVINFK